MSSLHPHFHSDAFPLEVHRDIKPENFLFVDAKPAKPFAGLKLIDFGLSTRWEVPRASETCLPWKWSSCAVASFHVDLDDLFVPGHA